MAHRRHFRFKDLQPPAPDDAQLREILATAACAPDHRQLRPWRFIVLADTLRPPLGEWFAQALLERDPNAEPYQVEQARRKAGAGARLVLAVVDLRELDPEVPPGEAWISLGCAIQNVLLAATAQGFGTGLGGGRSLHGQALRQGLGLQEHERAACFLAFGTPRAAPKSPLRPPVDDFVEWRAAPADPLSGRPS